MTQNLSDLLTGGYRGAEGPEVTIDLVAKVASYVVVESDFAGGVVNTIDTAGASTVTINSGITSLQPCTFVAIGDGQVSFVAGASVTINSADSLLSLRVQYSSAVVIPIGSDTYILIGDLS